jgi:hypothetical protein
MREGATEVMEGMAVGGKSCCPITVRGERHGSLASRSGVTNLSSHNYYCRQLFIYWLLSPRLSSHSLLRRPETQGDGENPPCYSTFTFSDERRRPLSAPRPLPCRDAVARGVREEGRPFKSIHRHVPFLPPVSSLTRAVSRLDQASLPSLPVDHSTAHFRASCMIPGCKAFRFLFFRFLFSSFR